MPNEHSDFVSFKKILSTNSLSECFKISVENLHIYVDIKALRVKVSYISLVIQNTN